LGISGNGQRGFSGEGFHFHILRGLLVKGLFRGLLGGELLFRGGNFFLRGRKLLLGGGLLLLLGWELLFFFLYRGSLLGLRLLSLGEFFRPSGQGQ